MRKSLIASTEEIVCEVPTHVAGMFSVEIWFGGRVASQNAVDFQYRVACPKGSFRDTLNATECEPCPGKIVREICTHHV